MDSDSTDADTDISDDAPSGLYSQLREGEICLLKAKPGNPSEPGQCELQAYSIHTEYFALSYVWETQPSLSRFNAAVTGYLLHETFTEHF